MEITHKRCSQLVLTSNKATNLTSSQTMGLLPAIKTTNNLLVICSHLEVLQVSIASNKTPQLNRIRNSAALIKLALVLCKELRQAVTCNTST